MTYLEIFQKNGKEINTNHLIALCEIEEDYELFCEDLEKLIKSKRNKNLIRKVYFSIPGKKVLIPKKYKEFIQKHKHTIDTIMNYSCLNNFTIDNYDSKGIRNKNLAEDYYYQYIEAHKKDIETIQAVILKIKSLGIDKINFDERLDFTKLEYKLYNSDYRDFAYLENMEIAPTYLTNPIKYKTTNSCYQINLRTNEKAQIEDKNRNIELNCLIFDSNRLPNKIELGSALDIIKNLAEKKKEEYEAIRDSIDFSISTSDLQTYFDYLKNIFERNDEIKKNQDLTNLLEQMKNLLIQIQLFGENFENKIIDSNADITNETMKKEKESYLERRRISFIDID